MTKTKTQKGFTLVELAIVMTIIGLLIGGILKGQELMENARVTATISQVRSYEAATTTFRDTFSAIPGDMINAATRIPNCTALCNPVDAGGAVAADSTIGVPGGIEAAQNVLTGEPVLFWTHLLFADLISGVSDAAIAVGGVIAVGETHPAAKIGGIFMVGDGGAAVSVLNGPITLPSGTVLSLTNQIGAMTALAGRQAVTPLRAGQIDRKMDDGKPGSGYVRALGEDNGIIGCADYAGVGQVAPYNEAITDKDCSMLFRIQG